MSAAGGSGTVAGIGSSACPPGEDRPARPLTLSVGAGRQCW